MSASLLQEDTFWLGVSGNASKYGVGGTTHYTATADMDDADGQIVGVNLTATQLNYGFWPFDNQLNAAVGSEVTIGYINGFVMEHGKKWRDFTGNGTYNGESCTEPTPTARVTECCMEPLYYNGNYYGTQCNGDYNCGYYESRKTCHHP